MQIVLIPENFNPRLREGGDTCTGEILSRNMQNFNPRLREGGDQIEPAAHIGIMYFNPRLREGGDLWN